MKGIWGGLKQRLLPDTERGWVHLLAAVGFLTRIALAFRPASRLTTRPYVEDTFYVLSCARKLAFGYGFSVDGIHPTNGVQPLIVILYAPFFCLAGNDPWAGVRLTFIVTALVQAISILLVAELVRSITKNEGENEQPLFRSPVLAAALIWTFAIPLFVHMSLGLETGLYSLLILSSTLCYARLLQRRATGGSTRWQTILLGILLGLTVLARIDAVFFVAAIAGIEVFRGSVRSGLVIGFIALLVSSPWWIYNYAVFHSFMPISGQSESVGSFLSENLRRGFVELTGILYLFFHLPYLPKHYWIDLAVSLISIALVIRIVRRSQLQRFLLTSYELAPLLPLAASSLALVVYYVFFFGAPHFLARYFQPLRILWSVLAALAWPAIYDAARSLELERKRILRPLVAVAVCVVLAFTVDRYVVNFVTADITEFYYAGKWAEDHSQSTIGMTQSGIASFISPNVVNLDGKVNAQALNAILDGQMGKYIAETHFDYLIDWDEFVAPLVQAAKTQGIEYRRVDSIGRLEIYQRMR